MRAAKIQIFNSTLRAHAPRIVHNCAGADKRAILQYGFPEDVLQCRLWHRRGALVFYAGIRLWFAGVAAQKKRRDDDGRNNQQCSKDDQCQSPWAGFLARPHYLATAEFVLFVLIFRPKIFSVCHDVRPSFCAKRLGCYRPSACFSVVRATHESRVSFVLRFIAPITPSAIMLKGTDGALKLLPRCMPSADWPPRMGRPTATAHHQCRSR